MTALVIGLVAVVVLAMMAYSGIGTRPLYVAGLLIAVVGAPRKQPADSLADRHSADRR